MTLFEEPKCQNFEFSLVNINRIEKCLQIVILDILLEKEALNKKDISKNLGIRLGDQLSPELVDNLLDTLWFEELIMTEQRKGKCKFTLTKKGKEYRRPGSKR
ncbi:MAG: hypothetical protein NWF01_07795 [Candidatus Bathyarchaeota archaeon]|nr:hypothetical protein [Candidatus Bathyarchaeota archaeon]